MAHLAFFQIPPNFSSVSFSSQTLAFPAPEQWPWSCIQEHRVAVDIQCSQQFNGRQWCAAAGGNDNSAHADQTTQVMLPDKWTSK